VLGGNLKLLLTILIAAAVEIILLYPITSMFGTCASFPLEDLFFAIYWPWAKWLLSLGVNHFWATFLVVAIPNNFIGGVVIFLSTNCQARLKPGGREVVCKKPRFNQPNQQR